MSTVETNLVQPSTGTTLTLGAASDVIQIPASGEIDIASGATLDVNGTIDLTGATTTGFPAGGLTEADTWRVTSPWTGTQNPINANWERDDTYGNGLLGTGMSQSSGVFTFPSTGFWHIIFYMGSKFGSTGVDRNMNGRIYVTTNGGTDWNLAAMGSTAGQYTVFGSDSYYNSSIAKIVDVTNTTNTKVKFGFECENQTAVTSYTDSDRNVTFATWIKLGDT